MNSTIPTKKYNKNRSGGYALITGLIFFLTATSAVIAAISDAVFREIRTVRNELSSKQSYFASESGAEDMAYRIKTNKPFDVTELLTFATTTVVTTYSLAVDGSANVVSAGDASGTKRSVTLNLNQGTGVAFRYALQGGVGGIDLSGGATITGDIYTIGSIRGCGTCTISGTAVAAGKSTSNIDQDNSSPSTPVDSIMFGDSNGTQDLIQSFSVTDNLSLTGLELFIKKVGNPTNATINIMNDSGNKPGNTVLASGTLSSSLISTSYAWSNITLTANPLLSAGNTYWIVIDANTNASNYYVSAANSTYASGEAKLGRYGTGGWSDTSPAGLDAYLKIYIGENQEGVTGDNLANPIPVGGAYAYKATYVNATGPLYCQVGTDNNKTCDTSRGDPVVHTFPVDQTVIDYWKTEAAVDIRSSSLVVGSTGATVGPKKIEGNLDMNGGGTLSVSGTIWVTGDFVIDGNSTVMPADNTKSYVIIVDGVIDLRGGSQILGNTGSHIVLISLSSADPAISLNGGADDTVVFVPYGGLLVSGGAKINAAAAGHITGTGGSNIVYDPDVSKLNLITGPPGSIPFVIKSWRETE